jgi:hypothetical protein
VVVNKTTIKRYRDKFGINTKKFNHKGWFIDKKGYKVIMKGDSMIYEHVLFMIEYLKNNQNLPFAKKYLVKCGAIYKLRKGAIVHHKNHNNQDNRIENLFIYENTSAHIRGRNSLNKCFELIIKLGNIKFKNGNYYLNKQFDKNSLDLLEIGILSKKKPINNFKDLNKVKEEIKKKQFLDKINWGKIGQNYIYKPNDHYKRILPLDPCSDCSEKNPLYKHRGWLEAVINDDRFNLTISRLGELCDQTKEHIKYWIRKKHKIKGRKRWGFGRRVKRNYILVRVPKGYKSPEAISRKGWMREHRYIMEQYLSEDPIPNSRYLIDGKYLIYLNFYDVPRILILDIYHQ